MWKVKKVVKIDFLEWLIEEEISWFLEKSFYISWLFFKLHEKGEVEIADEELKTEVKFLNHKMQLTDIFI